ncbi:uncharacterized protein LOC143286942 [Babylonia areolata]|uniref:uncharacterized protein LOC143286942 n=1 Tax=Babylonia areolata TaxID=304850 RepID=UPI003FD4598D
MCFGGVCDDKVVHSKSSPAAQRGHISISLSTTTKNTNTTTNTQHHNRHHHHHHHQHHQDHHQHHHHHHQHHHHHSTSQRSTMDVVAHLSASLRPNRHSAPQLRSSNSSSSILSGCGSDSPTSSQDHHHHHHDNSHYHNSHGEPLPDKKRSANHCDLCGKRLLKLARWRNYLTLPCRCRHVFCKQCITGRLRCRQRVMSAASFDLMWTFPCPGSAQCGQELNVDWSRGRRYSKNLVARDLGSAGDSWEQEEEEEEGEEQEEEEQEEEGVFDVEGVCVGRPYLRQCVSADNPPPTPPAEFIRKAVTSFDI